jgi:hypothetical protein
MADRRYELLPLDIDRITIIVNPEGVDRGLKNVTECTEKSIWLPFRAETYFLFKDGYYDQTENVLIKWDAVYPGWTAETNREKRLLLVHYFYIFKRLHVYNLNHCSFKGGRRVSESIETNLM